MTLSDGVIQSMKWPTIELRYGVDRAGNDVPSAPQAQMVSTRSAWSFILDL